MGRRAVMALVACGMAAGAPAARATTVVVNVPGRALAAPVLSPCASTLPAREHASR